MHFVWAKLAQLKPAAEPSWVENESAWQSVADQPEEHLHAGGDQLVVEVEVGVVAARRVLAFTPGPEEEVGTRHRGGEIGEVFTAGHWKVTIADGQ